MRRTLISTLAVGFLSASSLAQSARDERPDRPQNPPVNAQEGQPRGNPNQPHDVRQFQAQFIRTEKGAYLGVSTTPAPQVLRQQLSLPRGVGLVVDTVAPKSPAEQAGLKEFDVLHKLNDQVLINQQQLAVLVRTFKPNETIKFTVIRDGKSIELSAKLEERDLPPLEMMRLGMEGGFAGGFAGGFDPFRGDGPNPMQPGDMRPGFPGGGGRAIDPTRPFAPGNIVDEAFDMVWDDGKIQMHVTAKDGKRQLVAKDKDGKELYNGPIDTEEQIKGLPPEVRQRLPQIGPGMLRFGPNGQRGGIGGQRDGEGNQNRNRVEGDRGGERPSTRPATRDGEGGRKVERRNDI